MGLNAALRPRGGRSVLLQRWNPHRSVGTFCPHPFLAGRHFGCTVFQASRLSEQVTEEAIEGLGGVGEGKWGVKGAHGEGGGSQEWRLKSLWIEGHWEIALRPLLLIPSQSFKIVASNFYLVSTS